MENLLTFALIVVLFLVAAVIAYTFVTNKIIKDQDREIEELRHKLKLKDIKIDYLEKSRAQYKEYFDSHKISSDPVRVKPLKVTIRSTDFTRSSAFDKAIEDALKAIKAGLIYPTDYFKDF